MPLLTLTHSQVLQKQEDAGKARERPLLQDEHPLENPESQAESRAKRQAEVIALHADPIGISDPPELYRNWASIGADNPYLTAPT